jgi:hypothetical protein
MNTILTYVLAACKKMVNNTLQGTHPKTPFFFKWTLIYYIRDYLLWTFPVLFYILHKNTIHYNMVTMSMNLHHLHPHHIIFHWNLCKICTSHQLFKHCVRLRCAHPTTARNWARWYTMYNIKTIKKTAIILYHACKTNWTVYNSTLIWMLKISNI